ncbi:MAG TPA: chemotaxis protein CheW, partial [Novosphingobium sp.]|nr:chemotaxis protein CheW [Novosphingobium sp.]
HAAKPDRPRQRHLPSALTGQQISGWIVDAVSDIVTLDSETLQPPPPTSAGDTVVPFLEGLAAIDDKMVMVLNLAALSDAVVVPEAA